MKTSRTGTRQAKLRMPASDGSQKEQVTSLKHFLKILGPGLITGASDDDPSGIGTYSMAGASLGYSTLWTAIFTFPLMTVVQYLCAKVGLVSGKGLAGVLKEHYSPWLLYPAVFALLIANTINAGADLGAIAAAVNLLVPIPVPLLLVFTSLFLLVLQTWGSYRFIEQIFRWLTLALLAYIATAFVVHPAGLQVLQNTFLPVIHWNMTFFTTLVAILGTTISPYLFFWQSDQEAEEKQSKKPGHAVRGKGITSTELRFASWDVTIGMFISNLVMYCIILTTAATLFQAGKHNVQSATDAALALRPLAGNFASLLLSLGLIGSGYLAVPVLTGSAAYALAEALGWKYGLDKPFRKARPFYAVIVGATLVGVLINFIGINPITALFWTAILNGLLAPPLLVLLMLITNNHAVMGQRVNGFWLNFFGWLTTLLMFAAAIALIFTLGKS